MTATDYDTVGDAQESGAVATLRADESVEGVFACTRKERQISRSGAPYLTVELRDRSGSIVGRAFRDADRLASRFERGDVVRVRGRVERFRDELQIGVQEIERAGDADPARFLPAAYRDVDELDGFLEHLAREVYDAPLRQLLDAVLGDAALRGELRRAPCSVPAAPGRAGAGHHAYLGGLLEHTVAVATLAIEVCAVHAKLDRDLLLAAALVHDLGRAREFRYGAEITLSREGAMVGHIELSLREIAAHAPATLAGERRLALEHCVLLHHGSDAAAGRRFQSAEALALHRINALDAGVKGALERGLPSG
ncbi:MAG TPA: OB-fold nucleic acid binding domain-containing protein [Solirubrobacteraceae bacterium]|nr:OB-fold nucleic acid binding domain-containing protein [Solirubrobacteraceae bacterium]